MNKILHSALLFTAATAFSTSAMATPLTDDLTGSGCVITSGDYADSVLTFTAADLVKAHGTIEVGATLIHEVTFTPNYGVTNVACNDATVAITLATPTLPATGSVSFDSLVISGAGTTASSIVNNTDPVTLTLTMKAQENLGIASAFTYTVPFSLSATVAGN